MESGDKNALRVILIQPLNTFLDDYKLTLYMLSKKLRDEYIRLIEISKVISQEEDIEKRFFFIEHYDKQTKDFILNCKIEKYGTPNDLLQ
jgi:hypothetical protein